MPSVYQSTQNNDSKRTLTKHIIVKFQNARNRDLKASREKEVINKGENPSLTATLEAGSQ